MHFSTLAPNAALPSSTTCASRVRRSTGEIRPTNTRLQHDQRYRKSTSRSRISDMRRVDGNFTGTTDQIIQWGACKWGLDEDIVRAQAARESWWDQRSIGDFQSDPSKCVPGHRIGADGHAGQCPASGGLLSLTVGVIGGVVFGGEIFADLILLLGIRAVLKKAMWPLSTPESRTAMPTPDPSIPLLPSKLEINPGAFRT